MADNTDPAPPRGAKIIAIPVAPRPTNREAVLKFLDKLREEVETGKRPISDIVCVIIEETEFSVAQYVLHTPEINAMEVIGYLQASATHVAMEDRE
jgi:hypothetical protein